MRTDILFKPRYGLTIGLHLRERPWLWRPNFYRIGKDWGVHWLDITLSVQYWD